jgi:hypothetical protein
LLLTRPSFEEDYFQAQLGCATLFSLLWGEHIQGPSDGWS